MVVQHNISGMNARRQLNITNGVQAKSSEKLSSGYKINRAADDAAGLAISEKMRRQIRGLTQASNNAQDGVSWCQIADGALDEVDNMLERVKELSVQAANDTLTDDDRSYINSEVQAISKEIDRIHSSATFNEIPIFDGGMNPSNIYRTDNDSLVVEIGNGKTVEILMPFVDSSGNKVGSVDKTEAIGGENANANTAIAKFAQEAAAYAINKLSSAYPGLMSAASSSGIKIGLNLNNIDGQNGTLASAQLVMTGNNTSTIMAYTMNIDTTDYPIDKFESMSDAKKADLAAVIAHEMTHLIMYDTLTSGMLGDNLPSWFKEGTAQTSSGDNDWVSNSINQNSTDSQIKEYMSKLSSMPYGAGYLATMYLGQLASGESEVNATNIRNGLDNLMTYMAGGHSLSEAIAHTTSNKYSSQAAFEAGFSGADTDALNFVKELLTKRGNGAGSILGELNQSEASLFSPGSVSGSTSGNYVVDPSHARYANGYGSGFDWSSIPEAGSGKKAASVLYLQVGSETDSQNQIALNRYSVSVDSITNHAGFDTSTRLNALNTIDVLNTAANNVSSIRSYYGALQNRLEHTVKNLDNVVENTQASESLIRDTDMAAEMVKYSNNNILAQAGQAMLAQANQTNQGVLSLLQ